MASVKKITMREYNGTDYDTLYPKTIASQVDGVYGEEEVLSDDTKALYGLTDTATPNDVFAKLAMPFGYYGFDVTVRFSDGLPVPYVILNGLQDVSSGNTAMTDANGRCLTAMSESKTPTVTISDYIGVQDAETTISAQDGFVFTPITITLERDTSMHLIQTSKVLRVLTGVPVDMCIVGGGASGNSSSTANAAFPGGGGGYVTNILGVILKDTNVTLTVGSGGAAQYNQYSAGGTTTLVYDGITATASGATDNMGNGSCISPGNSTNGTVRVFNDDSLPLPGGGGGYGIRDKNATSRYPGGADFGGAGGIGTGNYSSSGGLPGTGPGGGGGGGASWSTGYQPVTGGSGAAGGLYIRVNAPEVSA